MMTNYLLLLSTYYGSPGWDAVDRILNNLFQILIPIGICVILPIIVVTLSMRTRRHEIDKKTELMMKAVESGAQLDPAFFQEVQKPRKVKTVKDKLIGYLITACITSGIGLLIGIVSVVFLNVQGDYNPAALLVLLIPCAILMAVGIAFFIVYFVGKRVWSKELVELNEKKNAEQQ